MVTQVTVLALEKVFHLCLLVHTVNVEVHETLEFVLRISTMLEFRLVLDLLRCLLANESLVRVDLPWGRLIFADSLPVVRSNLVTVFLHPPYLLIVD
jgi:hypothetical protein